MLIYSTHGGYLRESRTNVDSKQRMQWALQTLSGRGRHIHIDQEVGLHTAGLVHSQQYLQGLEQLAKTQGALLDCDTYLDEPLWSAARRACGAMLSQTEHALAESSNVHLVLSRPGSHHAGPDYALGTCIINNLAVAAASALDMGTSKAAIIDFDIHHGNGTQEIFYGRGDVFTASMHEYPLFPGTGTHTETGTGLGKGANINYLLTPQHSPGDIIAVYGQLIEQVRQQKPQLLLMEAGFDGHVFDGSANTAMTDKVFYQMGLLTAGLISDIGCSTVIELGGGYEQDSLQSGLDAFLTGMGF